MLNSDRDDDREKVRREANCKSWERMRGGRLFIPWWSEHQLKFTRRFSRCRHMTRLGNPCSQTGDAASTVHSDSSMSYPKCITTASTELYVLNYKGITNTSHVHHAALEMRTRV